MFSTLHVYIHIYICMFIHMYIGKLKMLYMCVWKLCTPKSIDSKSLSPLIGHVYLYKGYIPCPGTPICARVRKW